MLAAVEERVDDVMAGDGAVGGAGQQETGVVVEPVEDLHVGAVGEVPVGEVGLPAFVGLGGFEPVIGALGRLRGCGVISPAVMQDAADRGCRGRPEAFLGEVPGDGDRAGVQAVGGELFP